MAQWLYCCGDRQEPGIEAVLSQGALKPSRSSCGEGCPTDGFPSLRVELDTVFSGREPVYVSDHQTGVDALDAECAIGRFLHV